MTREEAIEILQGAIKKPNTKDGYLGQAFDMAIEALEQQPCEDCISRQAVIDAVHKEFDECLVWDESGETTANEVEQILEGLPSVTPQPKAGEWMHPYKSDIACECSECHIQIPITKDFNYCPNCGAKMKDGD